MIALNSMAEGVDKASVVCCFMTPKYMVNIPVFLCMNEVSSKGRYNIENLQLGILTNNYLQNDMV